MQGTLYIKYSGGLDSQMIPETFPKCTVNDARVLSDDY